MNSTITAAFSHTLDQYPTQVAVKYWQNDQWHSVTYKELMRQAQAIATWLGELGVSEGDAVILPSHNSPTICAQLIGILWSGAHYVFIDTEYPIQRQQFICSETGARVGIVDADYAVSADLPIKWHQIPTTLPEPDTNSFTEDPDSPAYVVFTSGSTGTPKGVIIPHRGVCRLVLDTDYIQFDNQQVFLLLSALTFDASTLELWGPLLNGGTCVIYPEDATINPKLISEVISQCDVTTAWLTSSLYNTIISSHPECLEPLKQLLIGGEALSVSHVLAGLKLLPTTKIFNGYGPTENTTFTTIFPIPADLPEDTRHIPIGYPIKGTHCEIFDTEMQPVSTGETGELVAFGSGLALSYLNRPELTTERFIELKCRDGKMRRGYRTGDLVRQLPDGVFEYIGRNDKQVKIDGHRIEPGEIEFFLNQLPQISDARVVVKTGPHGQKRLAAYVVGIKQDDRSKVRMTVADNFPAYMVPHFIVPMDELPKNQNGKLDEAKLPDPFNSQTKANNANQEVSRCWQQILDRSVDENDNFLDAGGTSLEALQLTELLEKQFNCTLSATFVFEHTNIAAQSRFFEQLTQETDKTVQPAIAAGQQDIAVIGMACRFPGADDLTGFWNNLIEAKESISFFTDETLSPEVGMSDRQNPNYVRAKGIIENCDQFDARFFGITPLEADIMDPQQRIMLQLAWHALEDAGCVPGDRDLHTGVFVGTNWARYFQQYVLNNEDVKQKFGLFNASLANESDFLSTRISYKLNLTGPSLNVFTACSTGLVAIAQACSSIERGECEQALAGGVSVSTPINSGYVYQEGSMLSSDGHCRPFDTNASGTTFNDGAGMVLLKRLDLAERDGDSIYAVVKGYAVNNDGENKASYTAPSVAGQVAVYNQALAKANVAPESIGFIETHGTATPLGDPIEVKSLTQSYFKTQDKTGPHSQTCALGSVKSNIGHTIHAAGLAGFIKTVKAVETAQIPPTLFFTEPNPKLEIEKTPFFVNNKVIPWPKKNDIRRAAVSSLGVGGTNAHIIIEEYAKTQKNNKSKRAEENKAPHSEYSILLSAKNEKSLSRLVEQYQQFFADKQPTDSIAPEAYTSLVGRKHFPYRAAVSGNTVKDITTNLANKKSWQSGHAQSKSSKIGFMFSGQGSQRRMMGHWLYQNNEPFREQFDLGCDIVMEQQGFDLRAILFSDGKKQEIGLDPNQTKVAQPALFLYEYGLAKYLENSGCHPDFFIGHSIGEFTAAAIAGVFSFEQAVTLVATRGGLMQSCPPGKMLAVKMDRSQIEEFLNDKVCLSVVNAPDRLVLSGPEAAILATAEELSGQGIPSSVLHTSHAFHSNMMEPIVSEFEALVASMELNPPTIPIFSTATGQLLADEATQARYWAQQLRNPVRFADAVSKARDYFIDDQIAFVEVGPGVALTTLVGCQNSEAKNTIVSASANCSADTSAMSDISACLNQLWANGYPIDWQSHFSRETNEINRNRLPGYAFSPDVHWLATPNQSHDHVSIPAALTTPQTITQEVTMSNEEHLQYIEQKLRDMMEEVTGFELDDVNADDHFSEAGLDSLLLTQVATAIDRTFSVGLTFRHLVEDYTSIGELRDFIAEKVPAETKQVNVDAPSLQDNSTAQATMMQMPLQPMDGNIAMNDTVKQLIQQQLQLMQLQLQALGGTPSSTNQVNITETTPTASPQATNTANTEKVEAKKSKPRHTPGTRITREKVGIKLTKAQQKWVNEILTSYQKKFAKSKTFTQKYRKHLADPRTVSGFNPEWKEIIFPIVTERSKGSKLWDIDDNELIDTSNGFGPIFFGHSPDFVTEAVKKQMDLGIETGPQSPLAGEVADLFCELTGNERCSFASTGSEAVIGAVRLARTVTGRNKVAMFEGSYHGIFDEVINRPGKDYQALPAAPGIPRESTSNMLVLPWGDPESLETLKSLGPELAAVLVEPVQSRQPEFHDKSYLQAIRDITNQTDTAMILDEVVTGFRVGPGGIRKYFDIDADLATYGKVIGGGYPIGVIGGKAKFMDALDGGYWEFGDNSIPEVGVTFFAGTFVRHPVALAAAKAILERIKSEGDSLYEELAKKTQQMADEAKSFIKDMKCEAKFEEFASYFYVSVPANAHWGHLLFTMMTLEGIHIQQYRPNFLTTEHSPEDVTAIISAFKKSLAKLISHGLIEGDMVAANDFLSSKPSIPEGARLGKNARGEPAYFIEDPNKSGKYIEVGKP